MVDRYPILGAHMSIAGGFDKAVAAAAALGMSTCQIFTKNNTQWRARPLGDDETRRFRQAVDECGIRQPIGHSSYLINLASREPALQHKSIDGLVSELQRADRLGLWYIVVHPGACTFADEQTGINNVIASLDEVRRQTRDLRCQCLLETTAGQGTSVGWRFEQLAQILDRVRDPDWLGVCFDTCHVFAAGYGLGDEKSYNSTLQEFDRFVGLRRIKALHLNDSRREQGSRVDRHEHIGRGRMGLAPFRLFLNDPRFLRTPMYLETPKGLCNGRDWDAVNLRRLRRLIRRRS